MSLLEHIETLLPQKLGDLLRQLPEAEELRLRLGRPPSIVTSGRETPLAADPVTRDLLMEILERATGASMHAAETTLKKGYLSYRGLRIGVCGEGLYREGEFTGLKSFSSLAIRLPHALPAEVREWIEKLPEPGTASILIAAPPGVGKTTLLRALIAHASQSCLVSVADERNELACFCAGQPQFDLGPSCDVMTGIPKTTAAMMQLRGMGPQIIAMDEITQKEDLDAVMQIAGCGVRIYATVHGACRADLEKRVLYRELLNAGIFQELVTIKMTDGRRYYTRETLAP